MPTVTLTTCQGQAIRPHLNALAHLRIRVFRDYPYLYDGDLGYESDYLARYAECPRSLFVLAFDDEKLVGAATGMPLADDVAEFRAPFETHDIPINQIFYYGESVLLSAYRGHGIGKTFMRAREQHAADGGFTTVAFCAVERPDNHPLKPERYVPLHDFWQAQGYRRQAQLATTFYWKDIGSDTQTDKPMVFWTKTLR